MQRPRLILPHPLLKRFSYFYKDLSAFESQMTCEILFHWIRIRGSRNRVYTDKEDIFEKTIDFVYDTKKDCKRYHGFEVVFKPKNMTVEKLQKALNTILICR